MAATQTLPSLMSSNYFPNNNDKFVSEEDAEWLKLEQEHSQFNLGFPFTAPTEQTGNVAPSTLAAPYLMSHVADPSTNATSGNPDVGTYSVPYIPYNGAVPGRNQPAPSLVYPFPNQFVSPFPNSNVPMTSPFSSHSFPPQFSVPMMPLTMNSMSPVFAPSTGYQQMVPFYHQFFNQFQHMMKNQASEEITDDKKRRPNRSFVRRVRQTRPKVVEAKGAVQCKGHNRKKGTQCKNAALMEYIGPRPIYCAEHIELDPESLYEKCKSPYQKEVGDNKGCKEVVLKEFGLCYKHFHDLCNDYIRNRDHERAKHMVERVAELLSQLEREALAAKKKDGDLYQRKNKLIPKFQEMKKLSIKCLETIEALQQREGQNTATGTSNPANLPLIQQNEFIVARSSPLLELSEVEEQLNTSDFSSDSDFSDEAEQFFAN